MPQLNKKATSEKAKFGSNKNELENHLQNNPIQKNRKNSEKQSENAACE